jgi:ComF family protein
MSWRSVVVESLNDAWSVLMPIACAGCGADDRSLCAQCLLDLVADVQVSSIPAARGDLELFSALRYERRVRRVVLALKEQGRTDAAPALSRSLATAITQALEAHPDAELAPVPSSRAAYRRRGYDPLRLLLRRAGWRAQSVLSYSRSTHRQKTLTRADRAANLAGAFIARRDLRGRRFIVVDDIFTSGATVIEAARALAAAGGEVACAATLAFTPRLLPMRDNDRGEDYGGAKGAQS